MIATKRCHKLKSMSVVGGFLDGLNVDFAEGLNCLIGHRGTGKTTVLEFVRYAIDGFSTGDTGSTHRRRVENLVKRNLGDGRIRLTIQTKDGLEYIVDRTTSGNPLVLTADGQPTDITINSGGIFGADIFSQNEVENIADSTESQLALIDSFVAEEMSEMETAIAEVQARLQANAKTIVPAQTTLAKLADELTTLKSVEDRIEKLADVGGENADEMNVAQTRKALRDRETRVLDETGKLVDEYAKRLGNAGGRFGTRVDGMFPKEILKGPNGEILETVRQVMQKTGTELDALFDQMVTVLKNARGDITNEAQKLRTRHSSQELAFRDLMSKFKEAQGLATERAEWERKRNDLLNKKRQHAELKAKLDKLQSERRELMDRLTDLRDQRFQLRQAVADRITDGVSSPVRVRIAQDESREPYVNLLSDALKRAGLHHKTVATRIAKVVAPSELVTLVRNHDTEALLKQTALNNNQVEKVIIALSDMETLLRIETVNLTDLPRIELHDGDDWKDSLSLSTGQKCTTILPILLLESENPLLVDQPEDNLDNRFIYDTVVESLRKVKTSRQLILITHNPNIPVLGDAAGVFVLTSDGAKSWLLNKGNVDTCKSEIINLLEGGVEAFAQRRERYAC